MVGILAKKMFTMTPVISNTRITGFNFSTKCNDDKQAKHKEHNSTLPYRNGHNWFMHMVRRSEIRHPSN